MKVPWKGLAALAILGAGAIILIGPRLGGSAQPVTGQLPTAIPSTAQAQTEVIQPTPTADPAQDIGKRIAALQTKVVESPDAASFRELGQLYMGTRQFPQAADNLASSLALEPDNATVRAQFATALLYLGLVNMARRELQSAVDADPSQAQIRFDFAIVLSHSNPQDIPGAIVQWQEAIRLAPDTDLARSAEKYIASYATPTAGEGATPAAQ